MMLSVAHSDRLGVVPENILWLYADDDHAGYARAIALFGEKRRLLEPAAFQTAIAETAGEFLRWVDSALRDCPRDYWIAASFFKDIVCTPVFLHLACLRMAVRAADDGRSVVLITRSAALASQVRKIGGVGSASTRPWRRDAFRAWARTWVHVLCRPWFVYARSVLAKSVLGSRYRANLRDTQMLVDTFVFPEDIRADGRYSDRFFPGLIEWYRARGIRAASMPFTGHLPWHQLHSIYRRMRASDIRFAPGELFLGVADCITGVRRALRAFLRPPEFSATPFLGIPVAMLATHWWRRSALHTVVYQIWRCVPRRMAEQGLKPVHVLEWHENQPVNSAITLGFHEDCVATQVIAGRQYFPAAGIVNFFSTPGGVRAGATPQVNWACGPRIAELFAAHDDAGRYEVVPALRYAHLFEHAGGAAEGTKLLVFLTSSPEESLSILECVFAAACKTLAGFDAIVVKAHQALPGNIRKVAEQQWPAARESHVSWEERATSVLLGEAKAVVTAGSSVALEAVCRGVPVIVTGRHAGINANPLDSIDSRLWRITYGPRDLEHIMQQWLPAIADWETRRELGRRVRDQYLTATTPETMLAFDPRHRDNVGNKGVHT